MATLPLKPHFPTLLAKLGGGRRAAKFCHCCRWRELLWKHDKQAQAHTPTSKLSSPGAGCQGHRWQHLQLPSRSFSQSAHCQPTAEMVQPLSHTRRLRQEAPEFGLHLGNSDPEKKYKS